VILQCVRYTVQNNFFTANAGVEVKKGTQNLNAILQCVHYVVGTNFLGAPLHADCDDVMGSEEGGGRVSQNCKLVCNSVNEINNKKCVAESDTGAAVST
jgi:hypothetical protein